MLGLIRDNNELRNAYEDLTFYQELTDEDPNWAEVLKEKIKTLKKRIREYVKKEKMDHFCIKSDCDGYIEKILLPDRIDSKEEADIWFKENEYRTCKPSQYDCTGQLFTGWYRIFHINDRYVAYHCLCMDV